MTIQVDIDRSKVFNNILDKLKKETLLSYFNISKRTFIFTDAHQSGKAEKSYAQLDLETMAVDFALMRFCLYLLGVPNDTTIVTDHHPLLSVFNGKRNGLIRTESVRLRLQGIGLSLQYRKVITNSVDYLSRHGIS